MSDAPSRESEREAAHTHALTQQRGGRAERGFRTERARPLHPPPSRPLVMVKGKADKGKAKGPPLTEEERLVQAEMEALKVRAVGEMSSVCDTKRKTK